jgi:hypothetical protein
MDESSEEAKGSINTEVSGISKALNKLKIKSVKGRRDNAIQGSPNHVPEVE